MRTDIGALFMSPHRKAMPWGGERWEAAAHAHGSSTVCGGPCDGRALDDVAAEYGEALLGRRNRNGFPLLFKVIDARERLSVQVHPNDEYAARISDRGKAEMWIVLGAQPGAGVYLGFNKPISSGEYRECIAGGTLASRLRFIPARPGDVFFIPPGMVHAVGGGLTVAEIQQNSDVTYRVYDWGRVGGDGKPRALHIRRALDVSDLSASGARARRLDTDGMTFLPACRFFAAHLWRIGGDMKFGGGDSFHILYCASGMVTLDGRPLPRGSTAVLPACAECAVGGAGRLYDFWVPDFTADYIAPLSLKFNLAEIIKLWYNV